MSRTSIRSRHSKSQATQAPFYLLPGGEAIPYCHSCGRVITTRRAKTQDENNTNTAPKYCSHRCRTRKPGRVDKELERAFVYFLSEAKQHPKPKQAKTKSDARIIVSCSTVESHVFGTEKDHEGEASHTESKAGSAAPVDKDHPSTYQAHQSVLSHVHLPARQSEPSLPSAESVSDVGGSLRCENGRSERFQETDEMLERRKQGQRKAKERETTKRAARRGVIFGFAMEPEDGGDSRSEPSRKFCEAVVDGKVVEPSFAKGDWAIRWRQ